jgi:hypothetical protein
LGRCSEKRGSNGRNCNKRPEIQDHNDDFFSFSLAWGLINAVRYTGIEKSRQQGILAKLQKTNEVD